MIEGDLSELPPQLAFSQFRGSQSHRPVGVYLAASLLYRTLVCQREVMDALVTDD